MIGAVLTSIHIKRTAELLCFAELAIAFTNRKQNCSIQEKKSEQRIVKTIVGLQVCQCGLLWAEVCVRKPEKTSSETQMGIGPPEVGFFFSPI